MRKITFWPIALFISLLSVALALGLFVTVLLGQAIPTGEFRGMALVLLGGFLCFLSAVLVYRLFLFFFPLREGEVQPGSRLELVYHVYLLFYLILFYSLTRSNVLPVPLMRVVYILLGCRMGADSYSSGCILDPPLTVMGRNCIVGHNAVLFSHAIEGDRLSHAVIRLGDRVTVGANTVIMSGVVVGDGAIVAAGSVVLKNTRIGSDELWGGVPARRLGGVSGAAA